MGKMAVETHFDPDKGENVHDGTRRDFGRACAVAPRWDSSTQNPEERKEDRYDRHDVGTGAWSPSAVR